MITDDDIIKLRSKFEPKKAKNWFDEWNSRSLELFDDSMKPILIYCKKHKGICIEINDKDFGLAYKGNVLYKIKFPPECELELPYYNSIIYDYKDNDIITTLGSIISGMTSDNARCHRESYNCASILTIIELSIRLIDNKELK